MKSRLLAGVAAVVLGLLGAMMLFGYAQGAEARAVQSLDPVEVLVVTTEIPAGTPAEDLLPFLTTETLPATAVNPLALEDLDAAGGKITSDDLLPGEQLLAERLVNPQDAELTDRPNVPEGLQEVSFALDPGRAVGGNVTPGDTVGVFISTEVDPAPEGLEPRMTQLVLHKVLVTSVQRAPTEAAPDADATPEEQARAEAEALPSGSLMLTVAVTEEQATKVVFGNEFGTIWLSREPATATESPDPITIHDKVLYR
ncbi:Flp pilus assembly protein CpaB [Arthrobacter pityocampae]|uniref:Flp pilus assembly protein CpaB n=1 Tax=Arthrobacter pityocampae TaxID=547334 RepID=A0A2S5IWG6_9MICC|nr:Flp pilus assembly protein CpaB [Arthrobacter pityocampae]PPB48885.1 Flp pilus assembly protein CpaB [Arthrobacter pityocampae]